MPVSDVYCSVHRANKFCGDQSCSNCSSRPDAAVQTLSTLRLECLGMLQDLYASLHLCNRADPLCVADNVSTAIIQ